jgi:hypothetical protein
MGYKRDNGDDPKIINGRIRMAKLQTGINYYSEFMCEAIRSFLYAEDLIDAAYELLDDDLEKVDLYSSAGIHSRYAFLISANALESAANALLLGIDTNRSIYKDLEKLGTLLKYEVFCMSSNKKLDRGNQLYSNVKEIVKCRNEFVHPKPKKVDYGVDDNDQIDFIVPRTKNCNYPTYITMIEAKHVKQAISDILNFAMLIGNGQLSVTGDIQTLKHEYCFDVRSFGIDKEQ